MIIEQLRNLHHARPFRPFRVHLADGRALEIDHPEFLSQSRAGRTVIIHMQDETFEIIDLLLVTSLEVINGQPRRQRRDRSNG